MKCTSEGLHVDSAKSTLKTNSAAAGSETAHATYSIICKSRNGNTDNILKQAVSKSVEVSHDLLEGLFRRYAVLPPNSGCVVKTVQVLYGAEAEAP